MELLLLLLFFPIVIPFIAKRLWDGEITWQEMFLQLMIVVVGVLVMWYAARAGQMLDKEVWNGYVTAKDRDHGSYVVSYPCNCRTVGKSTSCDICTDTRYTVTWTAKTTVGDVRLGHEDSTSSLVYLTPDPQAYKDCAVGEPASIEHAYANYVKAANSSLFHKKKRLDEKLYENVPVYPTVHDFYKFDRVLQAWSDIPTVELKKLDALLDDALKTMGAEKQVNVIVIASGVYDNPAFKYAVEEQWLGGKKNDVVVILGAKGNEIHWADAMTWANNKGNELLAVKLRDSLSEVKQYDPDIIAQKIVTEVSAHYVRPQMSDFEYLLDEITPGPKMMIAIIFFIVAGSVVLTIIFHRHNVDVFEMMDRYS